MTRRVFVPMMAAQRRPQARDLYYEPPQKQTLGLRYTLFREVRGKWLEVPWAAPFRTGDHIRMLFESNTDGDLFLLTPAGQGVWEPAAPNLPVAISPGRPYSLPATGLWVLEPPAGEDVLLLVFGRKGDASLDRLMERARQGSSAELIVQAQLRARDLVLEKEQAAQETTRYAVNPSPKMDAKVVVEVRIRHR